MTPGEARPDWRDDVHHEGYTELTVEQARQIMGAATYRITEHTAADWTPQHTTVEIFHDGRWLELCRTDLCDNVATGHYANRTLTEWLAHYKAKIRWGARFDERLFCVIDAATDG